MCKRVVMLLVFFVSLAFGKDWWWSKSYGDDKVDLLKNICVAKDSSVFLVGSKHTWGEHDRKLYIIKINPSGEIIWEKVFNSVILYSVSAMRESIDGSLIVLDNLGSLIKIDSKDGNLLWNKYYDFYTQFTELSDGSIILGGQYHYQGGYRITKLGIDGNKLWSKVFPGLMRCQPSQVLESNDGNIFIIADTNYSNNYYDQDFWVHKLGLNGDSHWTKTYGTEDREELKSSFITTDGSLLISTEVKLKEGYGYRKTRLFKLDYNGDTLWSQSFGLEDGSKYHSFTFQDQDGIVYVGGESYSRKDNNRILGYWLAKLDNSGNVIWNNVFETDFSVGMINHFHISSNGILNIAGYIQYNYGKFFLVKIDVDGEVLSLNIEATKFLKEHSFIYTIYGQNTYIAGTDSTTYSYGLKGLPPLLYCSQSKPLSFHIGVETKDSLNYGYSLFEAPTEMTISPGGTVSWTPQTDSVYLQQVKCLKVDDQGSIDTLWFDIMVNGEFENDSISPDNSIIPANNQIDVISNINSLSITTLDPIRTVNLLDLQGRQIKTRSIASETSNITLNTSTIASGVYLLQVQTMDQLSSRVVYVK